MRTGTFRLVFAIVCAFAAGDVFAQLDKSAFVSTTSTALSTSNFYFAKPNEITITVSVIGNVVRPGRYEVSKSIDLMNLLALAGGASSEGTLSDLTIQRIVEGPSGSRVEILEINLEDPTSLTPAGLALSPGDVITVGRSSWANFQPAWTIIVGTAVLINAVAYVWLVVEK